MKFTPSRTGWSLPKTGEVVYNKSVTSDCLRLGLEISPSLGRITPGQFIHLKLTETIEPFLRRPFSIFNVIEDEPDEPSVVEVLYRVVGKGTRLMAQMKPGVRLSVLGPLGNGFQVKVRAKYHILVAGGIGIAALHLLMRQFISTGQACSEPRESKERIYLLYGAKTSQNLILPRGIAGLNYQVATEDGSRGKKGLVTDLLKDVLDELRQKKSAQVYACGPAGMTKAICKISREYGIRTQISLEQWMGCGVGLCRACVYPVKSGDGFRYATVCSEGPVFEADQLYIANQ